MADTYGVIPEDIAAELPGLFRDGFAVSTTPTVDQVAGFISDADVVVALAVARMVTAEPTLAAAAAPLARRYIKNKVKAEVMRIVWTGNAPDVVASATRPYDDGAGDMLVQIDALKPAESAIAVALPWSSAPSETTRHTLEW